MKRFIAKVSKSFKGGEKGFTLIELLIVIVILGVLAAAIIPNLSKFVGTGKLGAANAEVASVRTALSAFMAENEGVPPATQVILNAAGYMSQAIHGTYTWDAVTGVLDATADSQVYDDFGWDGYKFTNP